MGFKFQVGDSVKIVRKGTIDWVPGMDFFIGRIGKVISAQRLRCAKGSYIGYSLQDNKEYFGWDFCEDSLEWTDNLSKTICPKCGSEKIHCILEATITAEIKELIIDDDNGVVGVIPGKTINTKRSSYPVAYCTNCGWTR